MRILLVHPGPEFSVHDVFRGWEKALKKQGHQVVTYNTNSRLTFYGSLMMPDYADWDGGSRELPKCEHCGHIPTKKALDDTQALQLGLKGIFEDSFVFWPEVIFFVSAFWFTDAMLQVLKSRDIKLVMLHTESPYQDEEQMKRGAFADLNLVNDPTNLESWKALGPTARYMPHAYDPDTHYPAERAYAPNPGRTGTWGRKDPYELDFSFIGTGFQSRRDFFGKMDFAGLDVSFGGGGWGECSKEPENAHLLDYLGHHPEQSVDNEETARIYRLSKTSLNLYRREGEDKETVYPGWAMGPREVELAACETFFLRDPRPEGDEIFDGILPVFSSPGEATELVRYWAHPDRVANREQLAREARARIADRTFDNHARDFWEYAELAGIC